MGWGQFPSKLNCSIYLQPSCTFARYRGTGWARSQTFLDFLATRVHLGHLLSLIFSMENLYEVNQCSALDEVKPSGLDRIK